MTALRRIIQAVLLCQPLLAFGEALTCVSFHNPPWVQTRSAGVSGAAVEVATRVLQQMGHTVEIKVLPLTRVLENIKAGHADCALGLPKSEEYNRFLEFSNESISTQVVYFYARKHASAMFNGDFSSVRGLRIGTAFKVHYGPRFEEARPRLILDEAPTLEQNFLKLAAGRIDMVPADMHMAASLLASPALRKHAQRIVRLPIPTESVPTYVAFSKSRKFSKLRDEFDVVLKGFVSSHEYSLLLSRYGVSQQPQPAIAGISINECRRTCSMKDTERHVYRSDDGIGGAPFFSPHVLSSNLNR